MSEPGQKATRQGADVVPVAVPLQRSDKICVCVLGFLGAWFLRLRCATWRVETECLDLLDQLLGAGERILLVFWHGKYLPLFPILRWRSACIFTTNSFRGRVICEICRRFGYTCVLLPHGKGQRIQNFMEAVLVPWSLGGLAVDGPLGPNHVVKPGAIQLAAALGFVLVPTTTASRRKHVFARRWDHMELPRFFTRVALVFGEPLRIPSDLCPNTVASWEYRLGASLEAADQRAEALVSKR